MIKMEHKHDHCKTKNRDEAEKKAIFNRINRIEGQLRGIKQMIENNVYCDDVLIQVSAVTNSLRSLGRLLLENHIRTCVKDELQSGNDEIICELINSLSKLN